MKRRKRWEKSSSGTSGGGPEEWESRTDSSVFSGKKNVGAGGGKKPSAADAEERERIGEFPRNEQPAERSWKNEFSKRRNTP